MTNEIETIEISPKKVWTVGQIGAMAFWGGPFAGAFLMSKNYKVFENQSAAKKTLLWGALFTTLLFLVIGFIPETALEKIPRVVIPVSYMLVMMEIARKSQKSLIEKHCKVGKRQSHWKVFGLIFPFMALALAWGYTTLFLLRFITGG